MIRNEASSDRAAIRAIHLAAFPTDSEARLVDLMRQSTALSVSLVAEDAAELVGHIAFSPLTLEPVIGLSGLGLAPVAVLPECQGQGVGAKLVEEGLDASRRLGAEFVVVLGEPAYYSRFGFRPASEFGLDNEYGAADEFMAIELSTGCLGDVQGLVKYCEAFSSL